MGTQTLIQALQAIPWAEAEANVNDRDDSDENDADKPGEPFFLHSLKHSRSLIYAYIYMSTTLAFALSSSIHTIHRPVARNRRRSTAVPPTASSDDTSLEEEEDDFDQEGAPLNLLPSTNHHTHNHPNTLAGAAGTTTPPAEPSSATMPNAGTRGLMRRSTSLATVKVQRRARLAEKLKEVFEVKEITEVTAGTPSVLISSRLPSSNASILQKCPAGYFDLFVSRRTCLNLVGTPKLTKSFYTSSFTGVHVSYQLSYMFLCSHAFPRSLFQRFELAYD
jgi:sterol 3beta-glucosyltransferase